MSLLLNMLSRFVITFLPRSKSLLISWLQSPSAVILEPPKIKSDAVPLFPYLFAMKWWDQMPWSLFSEGWALSSSLFWDSWEITAYFILIPFQNTRAEHRDLCRQEVVKLCHGEQSYVLLKRTGCLGAPAWETSTDSCGQDNFQDLSLSPAARSLSSPQMGLAAYD